MDFATLALISAVAVVGPLLALPRRWRLPVVIGELAAGIVLGRSGFDVLHAANPTFKFLADIGFALVMFEAGTRVPIRDPHLRTGLRIGVGRVLAVAVLAVPVAILLSYGFHTGHAPLYTVLLASSSAALVLPIVESLESCPSSTNSPWSCVPTWSSCSHSRR
jgi:Kef-type K+ transport system membrane component KefB